MDSERNHAEIQRQLFCHRCREADARSDAPSAGLLPDVYRTAGMFEGVPVGYPPWYVQLYYRLTWWWI
jgi:hypothetical protein